jgi:transposase
MPAVEVPPQLSHRERIRTRRAGKSDPGDALAIARVALREAELPPVRTADASRELKLLVEARDDLAAEATRVRNRLHADLVVIAPGYSAVATNLVAEKYRRAVGRLLRRMPGVQAELARDRLPAWPSWQPSSGIWTARSASAWPTIRCSSCGAPDRS